MTSPRWHLVVACFASSFVGALVALTFAPVPLSAQPGSRGGTGAQTFETVRAQRFEVVAADGRVYAVLGNLGYRGITNPSIGLGFPDSKGDPILSIGLGPEADPILSAHEIESGLRSGQPVVRGSRTVHLMGNTLQLLSEQTTRPDGAERVIDPAIAVRGRDDHSVIVTFDEKYKGVVTTR